MICLEMLYVYVNLNQWTHGLVDTQQNNVNLQCTQMIFLKKLYGYICFKSVDTWTFGHTAKQYILVQCWIFLKKLYSYVNLNQWTPGLSDTQQKNISLFSTQRSTADKQAHIIKNKNLLVCE